MSTLAALARSKTRMVTVVEARAVYVVVQAMGRHPHVKMQELGATESARAPSLYFSKSKKLTRVSDNRTHST